jgi:hypothetical protein
MRLKMVSRVGAAAAILILTSVTASQARDPGLDGVENRIDRAENRIDERTDNGRRDRIEDRLDRVEDRLDYREIEFDHAFDRHERRSWRRIALPN